MVFNLHHHHSWQVKTAEAVRIQNSLGEKLVTEPLHHEVKLVTGADVSYRKDSKFCFAAVVTVDIRSMTIVEKAGHAEQCAVSVYFRTSDIPGRSASVESTSLSLPIKPDVLMFDGQGIAHPRRMGIAAHMGLLLEIPSIGCAKNRLWGEYVEPANEIGEYSFLKRKDHRIGAVMRTRKNVKPIFISPGHRMDIHGAVRLVSKCIHRYRLPEPVRQAHLLANRLRQSDPRDALNYSWKEPGLQ